MTVAELPPYGQPDNPVHNQVAKRYVDAALAETGTLNMVTSIVLIPGLRYHVRDHCVVYRNPRGGHYLKNRKRGGSQEMRDFILKRAASLILPFIFVYGIYVILHGAVSPGGSFAGGIIVGLSFIAFSTIYGINKAGPNYPRKCWFRPRVTGHCGMG